MALSFDPAQWVNSYTTWASPHDLDYPPIEGGSQWYVSTSSSYSFPPGQFDFETSLGNLYDDIGAGRQGLNIAPMTHADVEAGVYSSGVELGRYDRYSGEITGERQTAFMESHKALVNGATVQWANPERLITQSSVIPVGASAPVRMAWSAIPYAPVHPYSATGQPSAVRTSAPVRIVPGQIVIAPPGSVPVPVPAPIVISPAVPVPPRQPPGRGEKERKARVKRGKFLSLALHVVGQVPEFLDIVNALWKVLPEECKTGYYLLHGKGGKTFYKKRFRASQAQRMGDLYRCWTHMDMEAALKAIVANQLEDKFYGLIGSATGKAGGRLGMNRGLQFGIWDTEVGDLMYDKLGLDDMGESPLPNFDKMVDQAVERVKEAIRRGAG
jgi:hypothetical protein